jgi:cell wall-associated NlpC family hydrolase
MSVNGNGNGNLCRLWDENACRVENLTFRRTGDFFVVRGRVTNTLGCIIPHPELRLELFDSSAKLLYCKVFHLVKRRFEPGDACEFKFEDEWRKGAASARVVTNPANSSRDLNEWQDELICGPKHAVIQRGDMVFASVSEVTESPLVFGSIVQLVTRSPYYHMVMYDHGGRFVHAGWPKVEARNIWQYYFKRPNTVLAWGRPRTPDGRSPKSDEASQAVAFLEKRIGKPYDILGNLPFIFRADGLAKIPFFLRKLTQDRGTSHDKKTWQCSEIVAAAWYNAAHVSFVEDMHDRTYLSPADIYESTSTDIVCILRLNNGGTTLMVK